jgi:hypothetical protein
MLIKALESLVQWPLFRRVRLPERSWDVISWWESRRIPYNLIVAATGIASAIVMLIMGFVTEHEEYGERALRRLARSHLLLP